MRGLVVAIVAVLGVEIVMVMTDRVTTHVVPGGVTLFGALGAVALVRVAKAVGALGVQQAARKEDDDE